MEREFGKYVKSVMVRGAKYNDERKNTRGVEMNCRNCNKELDEYESAFGTNCVNCGENE